MIENGRRKPAWYSYIMSHIVPGLILLFVGWLTANTISVKSDLRDYHTDTTAKFLAIEKNVDDMKEVIKDQFVEHQKWSSRNAVDHHQGFMVPCSRCHRKED
jgi:hypothetical protein